MLNSRFSSAVIFSRQIFRVLLLCTTCYLAANAQDSSTDGTTPPYLTPGTPTGSFGLSGIESINLFNGNLNFSLPLVTMGGRGGIGHVISLDIEQKWRTKKYGVTPDGDPAEWYPVGTWWGGIKRGYGPGVMEGRRGGHYYWPNDFCGEVGTRFFQKTLTRLTFTGANGTEYELRDQLTDGRPALSDETACNAEFSRGTVFVTADGSAATFISDTTIYDYKRQPMGNNQNQFTPSGYLMLKDGTRYRIDNGLVSWVRDRNGNKISFAYDIYKRMTTATDSLNRQVTVAYNSGTGYDLISYVGAGGNVRQIKVWYASLSTIGMLVSGESIQTYRQLFPELFRASSVTSFDPAKVSRVELPDGRNFYFRYNRYGELARVELPTGGVYEYDWGTGFTGTPNNSGSDGEAAILRRVIARRVYKNTSTLENKTTYTAPDPGTGGDASVSVEVKDVNNILLAKSVHTFHGQPWYPAESYDAVSYPSYLQGREKQTDSYNIVFSSPVLQRRVVTTWVNRTTVSWWTGSPSGAPSKDPRVSDTLNTFLDISPNLVSKQHFEYDEYNNQTDVYQYDFGSGAPASTATRRTYTEYLTTNPVNSANYATNTNIHIRNLPKLQQAFDGAGNKRAETNYEYDNYGSGNYAALTPRTGISGHDGAFATGYTTRGNLVKVSRWVNTGGTVDTFQQYDIAGNVVKAIDAGRASGSRGTTTFEYDDRFGGPDGDARANTAPSELGANTYSFAFPTKVINALGHTSYTQFDYYLGKPVNSEDANGVVGSITYGDALDRPTQAVRAVNQTTVKAQTTISYDDTNRIITTTSDRDAFNDNILQSKICYDGLGRTWRAATYEGATLGWSLVDTEFDALGRAYRVSNPYRASGVTGGVNPSGVWTTSTYDALGRVIAVQTPDNATVTTAYDGARVLVTDQTLKRRISETDALGRLLKVWEITAADGATTSITFPQSGGTAYNGYLTQYSYDVLDNLTMVTQQIGTSGTMQTRSFVYNSLKRLTSATNPESDTISYQYDPNGNLTQKTDARNVIIDYGYDALNRNTTVNYSNTTVNPDITRIYDNPTGGAYGLSRFWYDYAGGDYSNGPNVEHKAVDGYDALGRPLSVRRHFKASSVWSGAFTTTQTYNLGGQVTGQDYPSGHDTTYSYDAAGRVASFSGQLGDGATRTYANAINYTAAGLLSKETFGTTTALYHRMNYNVRQQLFAVRLGTDGNAAYDPNPSGNYLGQSLSWNRGLLLWHYGNTEMQGGSWGASGTDNNGNVQRAHHLVPLDDAVNNRIIRWSDYTYDNLNRITRATEYLEGGVEQYKQSYTYDRWGNRTIDQANTSTLTGLNRQLFTVNGANNRLGVSGTGTMTYDAAGNLIFDNYTAGNGVGERHYDAENRMVGAVGASLSTAAYKYTYDADGKRTRRSIAGQGEYWQVYGVGGELVAEYKANSAANNPEREYGYRNGQLLIAADGGAPGNIAQGKPASQSTTDYGGAASRAVDGNTSGNFGDNTVTHTQFQSEPWWQVDLQSIQPLRTIRLWNRTDCCSDRLQDAWVLVSDTPITPNDLASAKAQSGVTSYYLAGPASTQAEVSVQRSGRYIRVQLAGTGKALSLAEVQVVSSIQWLVQDHLGSTRMAVSESGSLASVKRSDYLPFGEEVAASLGGRISPANQGYSADGVRQKFTGYERDGEIGLDFAQARNYAPLQGRFTSPDIPIIGQDEINPQTWNLYTYTSNNPLNRVDPDGRRWFYRQEENRITDLVWVNPNPDGSYSFPEGYTAFVPTQENPFLAVYSGDGRTVTLFGELKNGGPGLRTLATGMVEDATWELVGWVTPIKICASCIRATVGALWAKYLLKRGAQEAAENIGGITVAQATRLQELLGAIPGVKGVYAFGSRTKGTWTAASDLDIALIGQVNVHNPQVLRAVREAQKYAESIGIGMGKGGHRPLDIHVWESIKDMAKAFKGSPNFDASKGIPKAVPLK